MKQIMNKMVRRIPAVRHSYMTGAVFCGSGGGPSKIKPRSSGFASFFCLEFRCFWMTPWPRVCKNHSFRNKRNLQFLEIARFKCHTLCTRNEPAMFQLDLVCPWPVNWRSQCLVSDKISYIFWKHIVVITMVMTHDDGSTMAVRWKKLWVSGATAGIVWNSGWMDTVQSERNGSMDKDKRTRLLRLASDLLNNSSRIHWSFSRFPLLCYLSA